VNATVADYLFPVFLDNPLVLRADRLESEPAHQARQRRDGAALWSPGRHQCTHGALGLHIRIVPPMLSV
jgi:hypothetical protein